MNEPNVSLAKIYENMRDQMELVLEVDPDAAFKIQQIFSTASAAIVETKERAIPAQRVKLRRLG